MSEQLTRTPEIHVNGYIVSELGFITQGLFGGLRPVDADMIQEDFTHQEERSSSMGPWHALGRSLAKGGIIAAEDISCDIM